MIVISLSLVSTVFMNNMESSDLHIPKWFKMCVFTILSRLVCLHNETKICNFKDKETMSYDKTNIVQPEERKQGSSENINVQCSTNESGDDDSQVKILRLLENLERYSNQPDINASAQNERRLLARILNRFLFMLFLLIIISTTMICMVVVSQS